MKATLKLVARALGYEIRKILPASGWPKPDSDPPQDEVISGPWTYTVLQMANRHYQPTPLRYHRTVYGDDFRIKYIAYFLDLRGLRVLEIGPFEGHHSVILEKMGVRENIAIEARAENLRKCNRIKEKYRLEHTTFLQHDLERLASGEEEPKFRGPFDLVFCLGVLYHLREPGKALTWFRSQAETLFLGTHYIEENRVEVPQHYSYGGRTYRARYSREGGAIDPRTGRWEQTGGRLGPLSGTSDTSAVLYEADLISMLHDCGYSRVSPLAKDLQNFGPYITILAQA